MPDNRIVAVGLLTQRDLDLFGSRLRYFFPVGDDPIFADLLAKLDEVDGRAPAGDDGTEDGESRSQR